MLVIGVGVAPGPRPKNPADFTAASPDRRCRGSSTQAARRHATRIRTPRIAGSGPVAPVSVRRCGLTRCMSSVRPGAMPATRARGDVPGGEPDHGMSRGTTLESRIPDKSAVASRRSTSTGPAMKPTVTDSRLFHSRSAVKRRLSQRPGTGTGIATIRVCLRLKSTTPSDGRARRERGPEHRGGCAGLPLCAASGRSTLAGTRRIATMARLCRFPGTP